MPTFGSLFAGIGGIDLGLERAGWECRFQVEWDGFCQRVLARHWPDVPRYGDIHDVHGPWAELGRHVADANDGRSLDTVRAGRDAAWDGGPPICARCLPPVDLLAGGFPCQPFSVAGKQRRLEDDRWLWPEFARAIRELRPRYVLVENVPGLLVGGGMDAVLGDLAELGYDAEWESIPAAAVGAPHLRYRVWIVAYAHEPRSQGHRTGGGVGSDPGERATRAGGAYPVADPERGRGVGWTTRDGGRLGTPGDAGQDRWGGRSDGDGWWSVEPDVGRVAHGVPARVDRLRSLGNAVVPQVVEVIGREMMDDYLR